MTNPLLTTTDLPLFSQIKPEHVEPAIDELLVFVRSVVNDCLQANTAYSYENLVDPIENAEDRLNKVWSPISHLNAVANSDELRIAYNACLPKLSDYTTEMGQNEKLFKAYQSIHDSESFATLSKPQQRIITNALRNFKLSGVDLEDSKKLRFKAICLELSSLTSLFEENVLDATNAWSKHFHEKEDLAGLPDSALKAARQTAKQHQMEGWMINLHFPSYIAVMTYADNRELRQEVYKAYVTRASDQGNEQWDNSEIMEKVLNLRHEQALLLGFNNYAEFSLATKMAESPGHVIAFLEDLADRSWRQGRKDLTELREFAKKHYSVGDLQSSDIPYFSEKMRQQIYQLSQEEVKTYFPANKVLSGLFAIVKKLYGITIFEVTEFESWHKDVQFFSIQDNNGQVRGQFYFDLYARSKKRGGAWMDDCVGRKKIGDKVQTPVAYLTCNFTAPVGDAPALLTHNEVITLFHEFGHGLQHLLTQVDNIGVSGINGVEWDAVELPSQFMENWCWEHEALALVSGHYLTNQALPDTLLEKMLAAKNFQAGMAMLRQLEFSLFDLRIHAEYQPKKGGRIYPILEQVQNNIAVMKPPSYNRFAHSFSHIFAGGYAAGYYSYKWAEVLSSDAFSLFEEKGIFDSETGQAFLTNILEAGGTEDAMDLYVRFRGRKPTIDALLRHNGITA
jgi:oligopeptidase A